MSEGVQEGPKAQYLHYFHIENEDGESVAWCNVERRHGVMYITQLNVKGSFRQKRYAKTLPRRVIDEFGSEEDIYLYVMSNTGRPLSDTELMTWYTSFGFEAASFPGGMVRKKTPCSDFLYLKMIKYASDNDIDPAELLQMIDAARNRIVQNITSEAVNE